MPLLPCIWFESSCKDRLVSEVALANLLWASALAGVAPEALRAALGKGAALQALDRLQGAELARCLWALGPNR